MKFYKGLLSFAVCVMVVLSAGNASASGLREREKEFEFRNPQDYAEHIEKLMSSMTAREKFAQLMIVEVSAEDVKPSEVKKLNHLVSKERVGGLILDDDPAGPSLARLNELQKKVALPNRRNSGLPLLITTDGEWGLSMRYPEYPYYPRQMQLGALISDELVYEMGKAVGRECREANVLVNYAPDIDININAENPVINTRSFGQDKEKVSQWGIAYMRGMQDAGILTCAKHFPGHGDTNVDSHRGLPVLEFDSRRLDEFELYPFKRLCAEGVDMVMIGHLSVPSLDASGTPASISYPIITGLLKEKMGYKGIIITDALGMDGIAEDRKPDEVCLASYNAGADILLMPDDPVKALDLLVKELNSGRLSSDELDARVRKVLELKAKLGMFDKDYTPFVDLDAIKEHYQRPEHLALIQKIADRSVTVVSNNGMLPFKEPAHHPLAVQDKNPKKAPKKLAYLGFGIGTVSKENFSDNVFGSELMKYTDIDTFYISKDASLEELDSLRQRLLDYKAVILGVHYTENLPQKNYGIDPDKLAFFSAWALEQNIAVAYFGNPYAINRMPEFNNFKAFIVAYSNAPSNQVAVAKIMFGAIAPQGILPVDSGRFKAGYKALVNPWFE